MCNWKNRILTLKWLLLPVRWCTFLVVTLDIIPINGLLYNGIGLHNAIDLVLDLDLYVKDTNLLLNS